MDATKPSDNKPQWKRGLLPSVLSAALVTTLIDLAMPYGAYESDLSFTSLVGLSAFAYLLVALFIGRVYGAASGFNILSIGLGIAVGTFVAAIAASSLFGQSRNLWPFTIVLYWAIGALPVTIGVLSGGFWRAQSAKRSAT